jgi:hypothetical protein
LYGLYLCRIRDLQGVKRSLLLLIAVTWLIWFVVGSVGWLRYAVVGVAFLSMFTAKLFAVLTGGFAIWQPGDASENVTPTRRINAPNIAVAIAVALMIASPLQGTFRKEMLNRDSTAMQFAAHLDSVVPPGAVVEAFEAEIVFLSARDFRQPSLDVVMRTVRQPRAETPNGLDFYQLSRDSTYLVNGPMSKRTSLFGLSLARGCCSLLYQFGDYDLYQLGPTDRLGEGSPRAAR